MIDISLYEVSKSELLQLGNQFRAAGDEKNPFSLSNTGGVSQQHGLVGFAARTLKGPLDFALGLPPSTLSLFQDKGKAKLLATTQVHVLDGGQHQVRIGQRVPVKTGASTVLNLGAGTNTGSSSNNSSTNVPNSNPNPGFGTVDNIQYEAVGLNIDMQPLVFDDEVQVKMRIESSSVDRSTGDLTPSFNQRTMSSVARMKDGQTTMIAGVSRREDSRQVKGIPLIGLIPILGRFFSTPATSNQQSDVVITVTPHILRRADIRREDHLSRDAGRGPDASRQLTVQEIVRIADEEESQQLPVAADIEPGKTSGGVMSEGRESTSEPLLRDASVAGAQRFVRASAASGMTSDALAAPMLTLNVKQARVIGPGQTPDSVGVETELGDVAAEGSETEPVLVAATAVSAAVKGQDFYLAISLHGRAEISSATVSIDYDPGFADVKQVRSGGLMNALPIFTARQGRLTVNIELPSGATGVPAQGRLLIIVFTTQRRGQSLMMPNARTMLRRPNGGVVPVRLQGVTVQVE
jgi:general secretion pathway protein D